MSAEFPTTASSLFLHGARDSDQRRRSAEQLCALYRVPIVAYLRRALSLSPDDAEDVAQEVLLTLLNTPLLERYERERGPFRRFLQGVLRNLVRHRRRTQGAARRGGQAVVRPLDEAQDTPGKEPDPSEAFGAAWVRELVRQALDRLRQRLEDEGRGDDLAVFEAYEFPEPGTRPTYGSLAERFGRSEAQVRHALSRVRERLRTELRLQLRETVSNEAELEAEWQSLFGMT